ncbi:hypothetical protein [Pedobacter aquatilis]|uniref:hypothetical protein n=1 Tax=Pedobacter aquatilis TaxID=351343 RepID=UPI00292E3CB9|nr:hypothetical protein [Pedobacter aquatilis]
MPHFSTSATQSSGSPLKTSEFSSSRLANTIKAQRPFKSGRITPWFLLLTIISMSACQQKADHTQKTNKAMELNYTKKLENTKTYYPFAKWREAYNDGLKQYTQENCDKAQHIFDELISELSAKGQEATKAEKEKLFGKAVLSLNKLSEEIDDLIETMEREDLCELIDQITIAAGLNPKDYADGEGIADEWREW